MKASTAGHRAGALFGMGRLKDEIKRCYHQASKKSVYDELLVELKEEAAAQEKKMQEDQVVDLFNQGEYTTG